MKLITIFFVLLLWTTTVSALSLFVPRTTVAKGSELALSGACTPTASVEIKGLWNQNEVFAKTVSCINGAFGSRDPVSFLVPTGTVQILAREIDSNARAQAQVQITPSRESSFLTVVIQSPSARTIARTEQVVVSVRISDAGQPVENAEVKTWSPDHAAVMLTGEGTGVFSGAVDVPVDAALGAWSLAVVAQRSGEDGLVGGEVVLPLTVEPAPIRISLVSPREKSIPALEPVVFRVNALYQSGALLEEPRVELQVNSRTVSLASVGNGFFEGTVSFPSVEGSQRLSIRVVDRVGNEARFEQDFFVAADIKTWIVQWWPVLAGLFILVAGVAGILVPRIRSHKTASWTQKRKVELEQELVQLQKSYFEENSISKEAFSKRNFELGKELEEINKKLNSLKK